MNDEKLLLELREALGRLLAWFRDPMDPGVLSAKEHLLAGCPNHLRADVEHAREVWAIDPGRRPAPAPAEKITPPSGAVTDLITPGIMREVEAYFLRNRHREPAVVQMEVRAILDSVYRDALHLQGSFSPSCLARIGGAQ